MKEIYENIFDKDLIKKHGERIHHRGGMTALQQNYYTLLSVLGYLIDQRGLDRDNHFGVLQHQNDCLSMLGWNR